MQYSIVSHIITRYGASVVLDGTGGIGNLDGALASGALGSDIGSARGF